MTVLCTRCGTKPARDPICIKDDPICADCWAELNDGVKECPGYGQSCGNPILPEYDLCPDCLRVRLDTESPRIPK